MPPEVSNENATRVEPPALYPRFEMRDPHEQQPPVSDVGRRLYEDTLPSVARITNANAPLGSAFAIDEHGKMATAYHVVVNDPNIFAEIDGRRHRMKIADFDDQKDVAILVPVTPFDTKPMPLGNSHSIKIDDDLYSFGHPRGNRSMYVSPGRSEGVASMVELLKANGAFNQTAYEQNTARMPNPTGLRNYLNRPLVTAYMHCEPGNSGGPVTDANGKVIGLADRVTPVEQSTQICPVEDLKNLLERPRYQMQYQRAFDSPLALWSERNPAAATGAGVGALGVAALAGRQMYSSPWSGRIGGAGALLGGTVMLCNDISNYNSKAELSSLDAWRGRSEIASDALVMLGGAALSLGRSRFKVLGLSSLALGAAGRIASEYIPTNYLTTGYKRLDGSNEVPVGNVNISG